MMLTSEQTRVLEGFCSQMCGERAVRFCGVVNSMGRLVAGGFKNEIKPLDTDEQRQMLYMQSKLEVSMKEEFDNSLGSVNYIATHRDNLVIVNIPIRKYGLLVLISAERNTSIEKTTKNVIDFFNGIHFSIHKKTHFNKPDAKQGIEQIAAH